MKKKDVTKWEEWKFTNENWKSVLKEIVDYAPNRYGRGKRGYEEDHKLVKRLKITAYELTMITAFLEEQGLIEYDQQEHNWIIVTSKGFDVALQNQNATRTERIGKVAILLTAAIAFATLANVLIGIEDPLQKWGVTIVISIAIVVSAYFIKRA